MRFIATADWQLGMTAHYLDDDARPRFHQARLDAVRRIGELAIERDAQFVVVGGDVFESNQLDRGIVARTAEVLRSFTVPVVLLPGNHDPLDAASIYGTPAFAAAMPDTVHVVRDSSPYSVAPGAEVVGAPWFSKRPLSDLVADACAALDPCPDGVARVVLGHGAVSTLNPDRDSPATIDVTALLETLDSGRAHAAILGDRHSTTEVEARVWYPGTPEVTARREDNPGNVLIVDVDPGTRDVAVEAVHIGQWKFLTVTQRLEGAADIDAFAAQLRGMTDKHRTALWLALSGTLTTAANARLETLLQEARELFARIDRWQRHTDLAVMPDDADFAGLGLSGFARAALDELADRARGGGEDASAAQDAIGLLYRFAGGGAG